MTADQILAEHRAARTTKDGYRAERMTNVNGYHEEMSGWLMDESDQRARAIDAEIGRVARACAQIAQAHGDYNIAAVPMSQRCRVAIENDERSFQFRVGELKAKMSAEAQHTERATARLAKLYYAYLYDAHDVTDAVQASAVRALRQADDAGRAWKWARSTKALARAYRALGATPPAGATGYDWHRGAHPLQVAMRQLAATVEAEP